jgi:hypothetical protein
VQVYEPREGGSTVPPEESESPCPSLPKGEDGAEPLDPLLDRPEPPLKKRAGGFEASKKYVLGSQVTVHVARERVHYLNANGKLITERLRDYSRIKLAKRFDQIDAFLQTWNSAERKAALTDVRDESVSCGRGLYPHTHAAAPHDWLHLAGGAAGPPAQLLPAPALPAPRPARPAPGGPGRSSGHPAG